MSLDMAAAQPSSLAARRELPPLPLLKTSFDDTLLQVHSPRLPPASKSTPDLRPSSSRRGSSSRTKPGSPAGSSSSKRVKTKSTFFGLLNSSKVDVTDEAQDTPSSRPNGPRHAPNFSRPSIPDTRHLQVQPSLSRQVSSEGEKVDVQDSENLATPTAHSGSQQAAVAHPTVNLDPLPRADPPPSPRLASWTPPPLAQAYSQSIMHAELEDPDHHTLRLPRPKRKGADSSTSAEGPMSRLKPSRQGLRRPSAQRSVSGAQPGSRDASTHQSTRKIYILSASGYVLQYSSEGSQDRVPEKTLKLNPKSVAFACDAIPGKHWVIQILQTASDSEVNPFSSEKSFLSRLLPTTKAKKTAVKSMLLVVDSPARMNEWLVTIRREILKFNRAQRVQSPAGRLTTEREDQGQQNLTPRVLTVPRAMEQSNLSLPPSPLKPLPFPPSAPTSPTFLDSGYISSGTTLAGDQSSSRSSRYQANCKNTPEMQKVSRVPSSSSTASKHVHNLERRDSEATTIDVPQQPPNTAIPPLTPSVTDGSFSLADSPSQSHPSPDNQRESPKSTRSHKESPEAPFFTPATTPMQFDVSPSKPKSRQEPVASDDVGSSSMSTPDGHSHLFADESTLGLAIDSTSMLRQTQSATGLPSLVAGTEQSNYFLSRSGNASTDTFSARYPAGNAFAQQSQHIRKLSPPLRTRPPLPVRDSSLRPGQLRTGSSTSLPEKHKSRASFRSKAPLPLQITSFATTPTASERTSVRVHDPVLEDQELEVRKELKSPTTAHRDSTFIPSSGRVSSPLGSPTTQSGATLQAPATNVSAHSPTIPSSLDRPLRRPPSIQIKKDFAPFLATSRRDLAISTTDPTKNADKKPLGVAPYAHSGTKNRNSVLVPVVRPPIRGGRRTSGLPRLGSAPPSKPPSAPLPPTPPQANTITNNQPIVTH
ncbi:MAG: hypothetical protein Q9162_002615 [Coniocarpon cinnabarinum]